MTSSAKPAPKYALDIFAVLNACDRHDTEWLAKQPEEARKGFAPPVVLKWMAGVQDGPMSEYHLWMVNETANVNFWDLWEYPDLQYKLVASCGSGSRQKHEWVNMVRSGKKADKVMDFLSRFWPDANDAELTILFTQFNDDTFYDFVRSSGCTPDDEKEVLEAYDRLTGKKKSSSAKKGSSKKR